MNHHSIVIIGAGPAGVASAIQLKRFGFDPVIIEKNEVGGLLHEASLIENYLGFPSGILANDLISKLLQQLEQNQIEVIRESVQQISFVENNFVIKTVNQVLLSEKIIIASGTIPIIPETALLNPKCKEKILSEIRKIKTIKDQTIGIIGAGDASFDYALSLSRHNMISIFNRGTKIKALPLLQERVISKKSISYHSDSKLIDIDLSESTSKLICHFDVDNSTSRFMFDYIIFATGRKSALEFISPLLRERMNELQSNGRIYLIGDVRGDRYRQTAIAAGEGIRAAMEIADESNQ